MIPQNRHKVVLIKLHREHMGCHIGSTWGVIQGANGGVTHEALACSHIWWKRLKDLEELGKSHRA